MTMVKLHDMCTHLENLPGFCTSFTMRDGPILFVPMSDVTARLYSTILWLRFGCVCVLSLYVHLNNYVADRNKLLWRFFLLLLQSRNRQFFSIVAWRNQKWCMFLRLLCSVTFKRDIKQH